MSNAAFNIYQFHDNFIHGIEFLMEDFTSEIRLDIDHILKWPSCDAAHVDDQLFLISKGHLTFVNVTDYRISIDSGDSGYSTTVMGICIDRIVRDEIATPMKFEEYYRWEIVMTDGRSSISFGASSFSFSATGEVVSVARQFLIDAERGKNGR